MKWNGKVAAKSLGSKREPIGLDVACEGTLQVNPNDRQHLIGKDS